jgi:murein DD-endopeptidase MepM/ murein hydrolase activator NlpD
MMRSRGIRTRSALEPVRKDSDRKAGPLLRWPAVSRRLPAAGAGRGDGPVRRRRIPKIIPGIIPGIVPGIVAFRAGHAARRPRRPFPEPQIEIHVRARTFAITLSRRRQIVLCLLLLAGAAAAGWGGVRDFSYRAQLHARRAETLKTAAANAALRAAAIRLRQALARTARALAQAQARIAAREGAAQAMRASLATAERQLRREQAARAAVPAPGSPTAAAREPRGQAARLARALAAAERQRQAAAARRAALASRLAAAQSDLERIAGRAGALKLALARLTARLKALGPRPALQAAVLRTADSSGILGRIEQTFAAAGVDAERFFANFGIKDGVGGPFIPARDAPAPAQMAAEQAAVLKMLKVLPVGAPLLHYRETSPFGIRHNPFTGRGEEFHPGVDLAAPYETPVYATAPGIVTYAGWESGYGKLVRIDHGHGLSTGYGHLHSFTVVVGEKVAAGTQIGYEGSTGRSTGPHVIYEVRLNGVPLNPAPFVALGREIAPDAGRIIPVAAR